MEYKPPLPDSRDNEFWIGDKQQVNIAKLENKICKFGEHNMNIDFGKRDATCEKCGWGFRFLVHMVKYEDGKLLDREGKPLY
jgi:hypothetical protein